MKAKRRSKLEKLCPDRISTLPQTIIETILCLVSIKEAARTSILSTEWRYKWTKIPILKFNWLAMLFDRTKQKNQPTDEDKCYSIQQVLLQRQGPIHEFVLYAGADYRFYELDQIIHHLSRNHTIKKLELVSEYEDRYTLPLSVFSMHHLTHLHLEYCDLDHKPTFSGFRSLRSLYLKYGTIPSKTLLHLLSNCPSLKSFTLFVEQWELGLEDCTITELFECLPVIEHLATWGSFLGWLVLGSLPKELPTLIHLKYFYFKEMCFYCGQGLTFIAVMLKCSPSLEKIKIETESDESDNTHECYENKVIPNALEEYSDVWLEHLNELEIDCLSDTNVKTALEFVTFILARSPKLEKVKIRSTLDKNQELEVLIDLLRAPRVSLVEIIFHSYWKKKTDFRPLKFPEY